MSFKGAQDASVVSPGPFSSQCLGYFQNTSLGTAAKLPALAAAASVPLTIPDAARVATIYVEGASIRWIDDGQKPTLTYGNPVAAGSAFEYSGDLAALQIIGAGATINVSLYK